MLVWPKRLWPLLGAVLALGMLVLALECGVAVYRGDLPLPTGELALGPLYLSAEPPCGALPHPQSSQLCRWNRQEPHAWRLHAAFQWSQGSPRYYHVLSIGQ